MVILETRADTCGNGRNRLIRLGLGVKRSVGLVSTCVQTKSYVVYVMVWQVSAKTMKET